MPSQQLRPRGRYGYPVAVMGEIGKGKVVFSGCYYQKLATEKKKRS